MVFVKVVFFLLSSLLYIWIVCWMSCLSLVLVVVGDGCLLVFFVLQMILFYWLLQFAVPMHHHMVWYYFNSEKTQLICFRKNVRQVSVDHIEFNGVLLKFSNKVLHLGHLLSFDLSDKDDVIRATKDVNRKANLVLYTFRHADPFVLTFLYKMYCLSLYGCTLWFLSSTSLRCLQVAINKILRRIWHLPRNSYVYCPQYSKDFLYIQYYHVSLLEVHLSLSRQWVFFC